MKRIFSIIIEWGLALPTGTIAFWGTLVSRILTVDHTFKGLPSKHKIGPTLYKCYTNVLCLLGIYSRL